MIDGINKMLEYSAVRPYDRSRDGAYLRWLGAVIRLRRLELRLTQEALGELAGVHRTTLGRLERGRAGCTLATLERLAQALALDPEELTPR
jgi:DNA-binding XRE family transcriptional regulator